MPTLNSEYNDLLKRWRNATPECEECGADMTGRNVHETRWCWVCDDCVEEVRIRGAETEAEMDRADAYTRGAEGGWCDL